MTKSKFKEFLSKLEGPEGCNFRKNDKGHIVWICKGGTDHTFARKILKSMKFSKKDVENFLKWCSDNGGHCDCEILFNCSDKK